MYIHHAKNIATHQPYAATGYVYNVRESWYGPRSYPPIFPLLLPPIIALRGLDIKALTIEEVVALTLALTLIYFLFRRELPAGYRLALIALIGFNPVLWDIKDNVISDPPFFAFFMLTALLTVIAPRDGLPGLLGGLLTGISLYLAFGTRTIGIVLLPGLVLYEALKVRRLTVFVGAAGISAVLLIAVQHFALKTQEASYADQFHTGLHTVLINFHDYAAVLAAFWPPSAGRPFSYLIFAAITALAIFGCLVKLRKYGIGILECCLVLYLAAILIWPGNQGMRFLLPVLPLYLAYALLGILNISGRWKPHGTRVALVVLLTIAGLLYIGSYRKQNYGTIRETVGLPSFNALCYYIRHNAGPNDTFVFYRARALTLFTDRPASVYFLDGTPALYNEQWNYLKRINAKYVIYSDLFKPDKDFLRPVLANHAGQLQPVYRNSDFIIFRVND